tara:strand:+ start:3640 stop:3936 length:297 start_codon:yes stop_codon:yes gene_type:complete
MKIEDQLKVTTERIDKLEKSIDILKHTTRDILIQLQDTKTNSDTNSDLVPKDKVLIQSLLERSKQDFHTKFLSNILNSSYDTLTQKQYSVLVNIQNSI